MSTTSDEMQITTGELSRAVTLIRGDIRDVKTEIAEKPTKRDIQFLETRIKDLEDWQTWAVRLGIPALVGVVFNLVNTFNGIAK